MRIVINQIYNFSCLYLNNSKLKLQSFLFYLNVHKRQKKNIQLNNQKQNKIKLLKILIKNLRFNHFEAINYLVAKYKAFSLSYLFFSTSAKSLYFCFCSSVKAFHSSPNFLPT